MVNQSRSVVTAAEQLEALQRRMQELEEVEAGLREQVSQSQRLLRAAARMNTERVLDRLLQEVADSARDVLGCRYAAIGILNEPRNGLDQFVTSGLTAEERERMGEMPSGKGLLGLVMVTPEPLRLRDRTTHPVSVGLPKHHPPMKSFLGVPVVGPEGTAIGNLYCTEKLGQEEFSATDEQFAIEFAAEAAVAVENCRLISSLTQEQQARDGFYAMVNHELRNALTAVYGWADLFLRTHPNEEVATEIIKSAHHSIAMLNDLLDLSRLDARRLRPMPQRVDLAQIVTESLRAVQPGAESHRVRLAAVGTGEPTTGRTDPTRLKQILINLLRNAIRHSDGGDVRIELRTDPTNANVDIIDDGEGIAADQLEEIFEPFRQGDSAGVGRAGLGLTLSRRLARMLGGDVTVRSDPGAGARFTVRVARYLGQAPPS